MRALKETPSTRPPQPPPATSWVPPCEVPLPQAGLWGAEGDGAAGRGRQAEGEESRSHQGVSVGGSTMLPAAASAKRGDHVSVSHPCPPRVSAEAESGRGPPLGEEGRRQAGVSETVTLKHGVRPLRCLGRAGPCGGGRGGGAESLLPPPSPPQTRPELCLGEGTCVFHKGKEN